MSSTGQETEVHTYCDGQMAYTEVCGGQLMKAAGGEGGVDEGGEGAVLSVKV